MPNIRGRVIHGQKLARTLGYPTANIDIDRKSVELPQGVYKACVEYDGIEHSGALCIMDDPARVEVHVIGEQGIDLYDFVLDIIIEERVGDIVPYESNEQMRKKIEEDIKKILSIQ